MVGGTQKRMIQSDSMFVSGVSKIIHHYKAHYYTNRHNLALLIVSNKVVFGVSNSTTFLLQLTTPVPHSLLIFRSIYLAHHIPDEGQPCTIAGWGSTSPDYINSFSPVAMIAVVFVKNLGCKADKPLLPHGSICISSNDSRGPCTGDQGGPLIHNGRLVGILMQDLVCDVSVSSAYALDIYQHRGWIDESLENTGHTSDAVNLLMWYTDAFSIVTLIVAIEFMSPALLEVLEEMHRRWLE